MQCNETVTLSKVEIKEPHLYKVLMLDDNVTEIREVLRVLMEIFQKNKVEAIKIAKSAEKNKREVIGTYTKELATTLVNLAQSIVKTLNFEIEEDN